MSNRLNELRNLPPGQLLARAGAVLPPWVALILVLAIAWQLVRITWLLFPQSSAGFAMSDDSAPAIDDQRIDLNYNIEQIVIANLFGQKASETVLTETPTNLEDTQLNLTLRGTHAANGDKAGLAIIADDRGVERVYSVGDPISGGRKLHSVSRDQAILNHNGDLEALRLPKDYKSGTSGTTPTGRTSQNRRSIPVRPSSAKTKLQQMANNPAKLTDLIRPQPVFSNGKQLGYRVYPGRRRQQFIALGLKPGDLVTQINGTALDDPAKGAEIFRSLAETNQVSVTVERNGSSEVLILDTEQLDRLQSEQQR